MLNRGNAVITAVLLALAGAATAAGQLTDRKIELSFPAAPNLLCADAQGFQTFPEKHREYLRTLFETVYPEIVKVYGEPNDLHGGFAVNIYYSPGSGASMYLNHKSDAVGPALSIFLDAFLTMPLNKWNCMSTSEIKDHSLFLSKLPGESNFDHHFTHEIIHAFHDSMHWLKWYGRSWVEEGMTEAAAEIVADQMKARYVARDVRGSGINGSPAANLKHYDMWNFPYNGAGTKVGGNGDIGRHVLANMHFFSGGISLSPFGDDVSLGMNRPVIPTKVRYGAAASIWLLLSKALSTSATAPDFLKRLNRELRRRGIRELSNDSQLLDIIDAVAPGSAVDGRPVRQWLQEQALLKSAERDEGALFIDVRNPENFQDAEGKLNITVYAAYSTNFSDPGDVLGNLNGGELPMHGCPINLRIIDAGGKVWLNTNLRETEGEVEVVNRIATQFSRVKVLVPDHGKYEIHEPARTLPPLPAGGYIIQAKSGLCNGINIGLGETVRRSGGDSATYAMITGKAIDWEDNRILGVTLSRPYEFSDFGGAETIRATGAPARVVLPEFYNDELDVSDLPNGAGLVAEHRQFKPFLAALSQKLPSGDKHERRFTQPYPYTRIAWIESSPNFLLSIQPKESTVLTGTTAEAIIQLIPSGIQPTSVPDWSCRVWTRLENAPAGIAVEIVDGLGARDLGPQAPAPVLLTLKARVAPDLKPGAYDIRVTAESASSGRCQGIRRTDYIRLNVIKPVAVKLLATQAVVGGSTQPAPAPINVTIDNETKAHLAGEILYPRQYSTVIFDAAEEMTIAGEKFRFRSWSINNNASQPIYANPLSQRITDDMTLTAQYLKVGGVSITVEARTGSATATSPIPVPVSYRWGGSGGGTVGGLDGKNSGQPSSTGSGSQTTSFPLNVPASVTVSLEAPIYTKFNGKFYQLARWQSAGQSTTEPLVNYLTTNSNATLTAWYQSTASHFEGFLDNVDSSSISGWAWDRSQPNTPVSIEIYDGGLLIARVAANLYRPDLLSAGIGNGSHAFSVPTPASLQDGAPHLVVVRISKSNIDLSGSPKSVAFVKPPIITASPFSQTVCGGQSVSMSVTATGSSLAYQWHKNGAALSGATSSVLTFSPVAASHAGNYNVVVKNSAGSATSAVAMLSVGDAITITGQPVSIVRTLGQSATFSVAATGSNIRYQWRGKDGGNIEGATGNSYTIPSVTAADAGSYYVVVFSGCGIVNSAPVTLTVTDTASGNDARFDAQSLPQTMTPGQTYEVAVRFTNVGKTAWKSAEGYRLMSQAPQGNTRWGVASVELPASLVQVAVNGVAVFSFKVTVPTSPGTYTFQWSMTKNGVSFGQLSAPVHVAVK